MSVESMLTQTCTIQRWSPRTAAADFTLDTGTWEDVETGVACVVQEKSVSSVGHAGGLNVAFVATGYFAIGTDLRPQSSGDSEPDRIVVDGSGSVYYVKGVNDQTGRGFMLTAYLERRD